MLLRDFFIRHKPLLASLFLLSLAVGTLEGLFILIAKYAVNGAGGEAWSMPLLAMAVIVTLRTLAQALSARLELGGLFAWLEAQRARVLRAAAERMFPAYREPWRNTLVTSLEKGLEEAGQGISAGLRCLAALAHILVLAPALLLFSWKLAAGALALVVPALAASRLRAGMLEASGKRWSESRAELSRETESFADGLEAHAGNGRLQEAAARMAAGMDRHAGRSKSWETAKAVFPPALEWFFFMALAALALTVGAAGEAGSLGSAGSRPAGWLPFGALLLLLYRPIREWARHYPAHLQGNQAWMGLNRLQASLESVPLRGPRPVSPSGNLVLERIRFGYGGAGAGERLVMDGLDLEIEPGAFTWISGRNGSGKSTLLKLLAGIEFPHAGRILLPKAWSGTSFAYLPQKAFLDSGWTRWMRAYRVEHAGDWKTLDGILGLERILAKADASLQGLSGGERQRLCLAGVFASPAPYLLLDEPTTWLTAGDRERILGDLLEFWRKRPYADATQGARGAALVSHEPFAGEFCSHTVRMAPETVRAAD